MRRTTLHRLLALVAAASAVAAVAAAAAVSAAASERSQRDDGTFQNRYIDFEPRGLVDLLRWRWRAWRDDLPPAPRRPTPRVAPDLAFVHANAVAGAAMQPAVTWVGHATALLQLGGVNLLTDPMFSERASPLSWIGPRRAQPPGLALAELPRIDAVLVSHNHYDHCDVASLRALNAQPGGPPLFVVPLGLKAWLAGIGITRAVELDWWQSHRVGEVEVALTPVQHWSGRGPFDRMETLWGGYAVLASDFRMYFSGDTGYSPDFADTAAWLAGRAPGGAAFDVALIAIGAYEPRWFMAQQHVDPAEAVRVHLDLGAEASIGIHWGTFELTDEALDQPPRDLAAARRAAGVDDAAFSVLALGQTRRWRGRGAQARRQ